MKRKKKINQSNTTSYIPNIILLYTISIHDELNWTELPVGWGFARLNKCN